jgi:hypothetical protein
MRTREPQILTVPVRYQFAVRLAVVWKAEEFSVSFKYARCQVLLLGLRQR